eukprot:g1457.t1
MGGLAQTITGHPIDTIKVRLQSRGASARFGGAFDCLAKTLRAEGLPGLFRGAATPLAGAILQNAAIFGVYGGAYRMAAGDAAPAARGSVEHLRRVCGAAAVTGFALAFIESPIELSKCKVQAQMAQAAQSPGGVGAAGPRFSGSVQAFLHIARHHGVTGLSQGLGATLIRSTQAKVLYFTTYESVVVAMAPEAVPQHEPLVACAVAGGLAGATAWCALYPTDIVKTRLQLEPLEVEKRRYRGIVHCARCIVRDEGWRALFDGFGPCLLRAVVVNAGVFAAVTHTQRHLQHGDSAAQ